MPYVLSRVGQQPSAGRPVYQRDRIMYWRSEDSKAQSLVIRTAGSRYLPDEETGGELTRVLAWPGVQRHPRASQGTERCCPSAWHLSTGSVALEIRHSHLQIRRLRRLQCELSFTRLLIMEGISAPQRQAKAAYLPLMDEASNLSS